MASVRKHPFTIRRRLWMLLRYLRGSGMTRRFYQCLPKALRAGFSRWNHKLQIEQHKFPRNSRWITPLPPSTRIAKPATHGVTKTRISSPGVNVFAYVRGQFGLGESARLYARVLMDSGYPVAVQNVDADIPHALDDTSVDDLLSDDAPYPVDLLFLNPDSLEAAKASNHALARSDRHTMACWFWELEHFPEAWKPALLEIDSFLASSAFIRDMLERETGKPVHHVPLPVTVGADAGLERVDFGLPQDAFIFLTSFDFNSSLERKNPAAVIRAFRQAFGHDHERNVFLLVKSSNGHRYPGPFRALLAQAEGDDRVVLRDDIIDRTQLRSLQRCADAYVSLHRAEGFGLGMLEAMALGKPVIATAWSGNMEFMTPQTSMLVPYALVPVGEGQYPHHEGQRWADPDVARAGQYMRQLVEDRELASGIGRKASRHVQAKLSAAGVASRLAAILDGAASQVDNHPRANHERRRGLME